MFHRFLRRFIEPTEAEIPTEKAAGEILGDILRKSPPVASRVQGGTLQVITGVITAISTFITPVTVPIYNSIFSGYNSINHW